MKRVLYFAPAAIYYALLFFLSTQSYHIEVEILLFDKIVHCGEYAILAFLLSFGFFNGLKFSLEAKVFITVFSGFLLGALDEFHQYFVPQRHSDIFDIIADIIGISIGLFAYLYIFRKKLR